MPDELEWLAAQRPEALSRANDIAIARVRRRVLEATTQTPSAPRRSRRRLLVGVAASVILASGVILSGLPGAPAPRADAAVVEVLRAAQESADVSGGEYQHTRTVQVQWSAAYDASRQILKDADGAPVAWRERRTYDVWIPTDRDGGIWVIKDSTESFDFQSPKAKEVADAPTSNTWRAKGGHFGPGWDLSADETYSDLPRDPSELLDRLRERPRGELNGDEQVFADATKILVDPVAPADLRRTTLQALESLDALDLNRAARLPDGSPGLGISFGGGDELLFEPRTGRLVGLQAAETFPGQKTPARLVSISTDAVSTAP